MASMKLKYSFEKSKFVRLCENEGCDNKCQRRAIMKREDNMKIYFYEEGEKDTIENTLNKTNCSKEISKIALKYFPKCKICRNTQIEQKIKKTLESSNYNVTDEDKARKFYFNVKYDDRVEARQRRLRWDPLIKKWYINYDSAQYLYLDDICKRWQLLYPEDCKDPLWDILIKRSKKLGWEDCDY